MIGLIKLPPHIHDTDVVQFEFTDQLPRPMSDERYRDRLISILNHFFAADSLPPDDPDDRDEYVYAIYLRPVRVWIITQQSDDLGNRCELGLARFAW